MGLLSWKQFLMLHVRRCTHQDRRNKTTRKLLYDTFRMIGVAHLLVWFKINLISSLSRLLTIMITQITNNFLLADSQHTRHNLWCFTSHVKDGTIRKVRIVGIVRMSPIMFINLISLTASFNPLLSPASKQLTILERATRDEYWNSRSGNFHSKDDFS